MHRQSLSVSHAAQKTANNKKISALCSELTQMFDGYNVSEERNLCSTWKLISVQPFAALAPHQLKLHRPCLPL